MKKIVKNILFIATSFIGIGMLASSCYKSDESDSSSTTDNLPDITGYPIVTTNENIAFNNITTISLPIEGDDFYGQNANYPGTTQRYVDNGDGTVTDMVTGLMWQQTLDHNGDGEINVNDKLTYDEILELPNTCQTGGHTDWRVPSIKEQYSLMDFSGKDISGYDDDSTEDLDPFINNEVFGFAYGDTDANERLIDVQCASTTVYTDSSNPLIFGVNFADGRIKGYGSTMMGQAKKFNYLLCRGNSTYGINSFTDNGDSTITDSATNLMWMKYDSHTAMNWEDALVYAESFKCAGYTDWRLPDVKQLQSIVDYTRNPEMTSSAAIDPLFDCTSITNEAGEKDYAYYWSNTTHQNWQTNTDGGWGSYVCFGRAMGHESSIPGPPTLENINYNESDDIVWTNVHGAGAQRSDPKDGNPDDWSEGNGPQGDAIHIFNYVRLVRTVK
ncbi:MAG: DUF1566 domain-containing protein [Bacteroidales bacterium]